MKIIDRIKYDIELGGYKKFFWSRTTIKYLLLILTIIGIYTGNKTGLGMIAILAVYIKFSEAINDERFLEWYNKRNYPGKNSKERHIYKWMGVKKNKLDNSVNDNSRNITADKIP